MLLVQAVTQSLRSYVTVATQVTQGRHQVLMSHLRDGVKLHSYILKTFIIVMYIFENDFFLW
ncbi:hypothetical protein P5618_014980 [Priestia megaterium]|uniref:hypothetical protein n=1 Tax=Priestia megaterium TaxID=1404 RepID=UPI002452F7EE|nr:hypothetical protein [Priestia megaterium]MDH3180949.1 hypothetical protein [Priestia megaterium]